MKNKEKLINGEIPITRKELIELIDNNEDVTQVDTSQITDFSSLFLGNSMFNQNISNWDVSNGTNFSYMFYEAESFNQPLNKWNVSNSTNFKSMFYSAKSFNQDISNWDVSNCCNFSFMFSNANVFCQPLDNWSISKNAKVDSSFTLTNSFFGYNLGFDLGLSFIPKHFLNTKPNSIYKIDDKLLFFNYKDKHLCNINFKYILYISYFFIDEDIELHFLSIKKDNQEYYYKIEEELFLDMKNKQIIKDELVYEE